MWHPAQSVPVRFRVPVIGTFQDTVLPWTAPWQSTQYSPYSQISPWGRTDVLSGARIEYAPLGAA